MNRADDYQAKAEAIRALAEAATDPVVKAEYLKLANAWGQLATSLRTRVSRTRRRD